MCLFYNNQTLSIKLHPFSGCLKYLQSKPCGFAVGWKPTLRRLFCRYGLSNIRPTPCLTVFLYPPRLDENEFRLRIMLVLTVFVLGRQLLLLITIA